MKTQRTEFYVGLLIWLIDIAVAFFMWLTGDQDAAITHAVTLSNILWVASLYALFLAGYVISYGLFLTAGNRRGRMIGLSLASAAVLGLTVFFFFGMVALLATLLIIQLAKYINEKPALGIAILVPWVGVLIDVALGKSFDYTVIVIYSTFNVLALLANIRLIAEHKAKRESVQLVRELRATQILLSATAKRDERLRIARDLHDALGHQLTALSLQLEVASHVKNDTQKQHLQQAKAISAKLLSEVRETVAEFRVEKDINLGKSLEALTQGLPHLHVKLSMDLDEALIDARQAEVIFRCVQEGLTNTAKHSNASICTIKLSSSAETILVAIEDNGTNPEPIEQGNGLTGMIERVASLGGELIVTSTISGFKLAAELPIYNSAQVFDDD
jgi:signal transduction histidine kinase